MELENKYKKYIFRRILPSHQHFFNKHFKSQDQMFIFNFSDTTLNTDQKDALDHGTCEGTVTRWPKQWGLEAGASPGS